MMPQLRSSAWFRVATASPVAAAIPAIIASGGESPRIPEGYCLHPLQATMFETMFRPTAPGSQEVRERWRPLRGALMPARALQIAPTRFKRRRPRAE